MSKENNMKKTWITPELTEKSVSKTMQGPSLPPPPPQVPPQQT